MEKQLLKTNKLLTERSHYTRFHEGHPARHRMMRTHNWIRVRKTRDCSPGVGNKKVAYFRS